MQATTISLVRHGEVYNPQRVYYGRLPRFRLSENGRTQAAAAAEVLQSQDVTAVYSSPMLRARQTAQIIAERLQLSHHISSRLIEVHTPFDGQPLAALEALDWDGYTSAPPEYEQPADIVTRIAKFATAVQRKHAGGHIVAVSHGDPIAFVALWAAGQPVTVPERRSLRQIGLSDNYPAHAAILSLSFNGDGGRPFQINYHRPIL